MTTRLFPQKGRLFFRKSRIPSAEADIIHDSLSVWQEAKARLVGKNYPVLEFNLLFRRWQATTADTMSMMRAVLKKHLDVEPNVIDDMNEVDLEELFWQVWVDSVEKQQPACPSWPVVRSEMDEEEGEEEE